MDFLTVSTPAGKTFKQEIGEQGVSIGRSSQNELVLDDPGVSRLHARIERMYQGYFLIDAGGKNGTYLNEARIVEPVLIKDGDHVRIGSTTLVLNGVPKGRVEFLDVPLATNAATTFLSAEDLRSSPGTDPAFAKDGLAYSIVSTPSRDRGLDSGQTTLPSSTSVLLGIIFEADKELVFHRPLDEILETVMDLVGRAIPFDRGLLMLLEEDRLVPRVIRVPQEEKEKTIGISRTIADRVVQRKESVLTADALSDARFREGVSVVAQQVRSAMCVPLWDNREVRGLIYIDSRRMANLFTEDHLRLLTHFANVAAVKIENARLFTQVVAAERLAQELEGASEIQRSLLPASSPPLAGYLLDGYSMPCRAVGGDLFDYVELPEGRVAVALGDVAGKGFPAALLMCAFQASLRALAELDLAPETMIERLNRMMCRRLPMNRFVTFYYGLLDPAAHRLLFVNAGHCPPWLVHAGGRPAERLSDTGRPLGLYESSTYQSRAIDLAPEDVVVCFSDGVPDCVGPAEVEFGEKKLVEVVERHKSATPAEIRRAVMEEIHLHHAGVARQDDITLVVLKRVL